ncbi:MAG: hydrolase [Thiothrix nivea]|nr:MAG: hydrolase [Thiothrix nivea]
MANFNTHITYAAAGSGLLSVLCLQIGLVDQRNALLLALVGTIGGILPDIDLKRSYPSRILFAMMGLLLAFIMVFSLENQLSILELWLVGIGSFLLVRFPVWYIFHHYTHHRGSTHSIMAALLCAFTTTAFSFHLLAKDDLTAWLIGSFLFLGFILHLLLDEFYSVDFTNRRIKRSFGSALKLVDYPKTFKSALLIGLTFMVWFMTPDETRFWDTLTSPQTYQIISARFLP